MTEPVIAHDERLGIEQRNRALVEQAMLGDRFVLDAGPYEAHVGFSNFCNMSCVMCWNGANPPVRKMSPEAVRRFEEQIAPSLSVLTPYDGSEPLIAGWDIARRIARDYAVDLSLTTNVQFLDEKKFFELKDITESLYLSIDSHIPEVFEKIRPRSKPERVFANLPKAIRLAREHEVDFKINVVFMTHNGPLLPESIEYFGDLGAPAVHVMQMLDGNGESDLLNPLLHFSPEYVAWLKERCIEVVRRKRMFLVWDVMGVEEYDYRRTRIPRNPRSVDYGNWDWRMNLYFPGYCKFVRDRVRVTVDGSVAPCSYSTDGELELGTLDHQDFEVMWNGPKMRDLRRAHLTADYPTICKSCRFSDPLIPAMPAMQFQGDVMRNTAPDIDFVVRELETIEPAHMTRQSDAPAIRIHRPLHDFGEYVLVLAMGGTQRDLMCSLEPSIERDCIVFEIPPRVWSKLQPNRGYWWWLFAIDVDGELRCSASTEIRCVIRHQPIPRIEGSGLRYPDEGYLPVVDLGSAKGNGDGRTVLPPRPRLGRRRGKTAFDGPRRFATVSSSPRGSGST